MKTSLALCIVPGFAEGVLHPSKLSSERTIRKLWPGPGNFILQFVAGVPCCWESGNLGIILGNSSQSFAIDGNNIISPNYLSSVLVRRANCCPVQNAFILRPTVLDNILDKKENRLSNRRTSLTWY